MKVFIVLSMVVLSAVLVVGADGTCKADIKDVCDSKDYKGHCSAKYAGALAKVDPVLGKLQKFAVAQIKQSFEFMLRASYFSNYKASRPGFAKLFRGISDAAWNDAIGITKLVAERGGRSVFKDAREEEKSTIGVDKETVVATAELPSLARALDSVKQLAREANSIHHRATHHKDAHKKDPTDEQKDQHDAHIAHYIQEEFAERYAKEVRSLAGHASDLKGLLLGDGKSKLEPREKSLSLFLFDEYLLKL